MGSERTHGYTASWSFLLQVQLLFARLLERLPPASCALIACMQDLNNFYSRDYKARPLAGLGLLPGFSLAVRGERVA